MKRLVSLSAVALLLSSAPSLAQQQFGFGPGYGYNMPMMGGPGYAQGYGMNPGYGFGPGMISSPGRGRFMIVDANDDGIISAEEAASAEDEVFTAMDADDDGSVTKEEYLAVRMGPQFGFNQARQALRQQAKESRFAELDGDGDGSVAKAEFMAAAKIHFDASDDDGDGKVTPWELRRQNWN
jgi:hypothetical protein